MEKCLLSIDWDYFIYSPKYSCNSYLENKKSLIDLWYKRYIQAKARGEDIQKAFYISPELYTFWSRIKKYFKFSKNTKVYVSDSHAMSYKIAEENNCKSVYLFDYHSDLGYGGLLSLNFDVNCSNWLGKLLKDEHIKAAYIFYSPYTKEKPEDFKPMNDIYNIRYCKTYDLSKSVSAAAVHICRSGAWTPPWYDNRFIQFVKALGLSYKVVNCPERKWDTASLSLSDKINYLLA